MATSKIGLHDLDESLIEFFEELSSSSGSKLVTYTLPITATENNQTAFTIDLETFDAEKDTVLIQDGRTMLFPNVDFTINGKIITVNEGWNIGDTGGIYVFKNVPVLEEEVTIDGNISGRFQNMRRLKIVNFNHLNVINMSNTYYNCTSLISSPVCGNKVTHMAQAYYNCYNLTGSPVCGANVTDMRSAYYNCQNLTGNPACGNNVTNMNQAYYNCRNLTGSPVCGNNVTNMRLAYYSCYNLTGSPVCGNNVTNMYGAYDGCYSLTGSPVCGNNVTDMYSAYCRCNNITGSPVCGNNVTNMAYGYCSNLTAGSTMYVYNNNVTNFSDCFYSKNKSRRINIKAYLNTNTWNKLKIDNTHSIVGANITWNTYNNGGFYNTAYNIYILPI